MMNPTISSFACTRCAERKVRCDRQAPCNSCVRHNVQCVYRPPKKPGRKKRTSGIDEQILERLRHYEALLLENGIEVSTFEANTHAEGFEMTGPTVAPPGAQRTWSNARPAHRQEGLSHLLTPASNESEPQPTVFKPQLLHGEQGTRLVDNNLWSRVAEEIHDAEEALEEDSTNGHSNGDLSSNNDFCYVLGLEATPKNGPSHPPTELIYCLWQIFLENVNPLSKLIHVPTLEPAIEKAVTDIRRVPRGFEALMFAIYSMAVMSLTDDDCRAILGEARTILLPRYVAATKMALCRAKFMSSTSVVTLQALMLHILSIRDLYEPRAVWSLTGVAIRIAEGMGMRVDGTFLGLSPFETEIRRRIWWQLNMHDFRAAELTGQAKFRYFGLDETTPKQPVNVEDDSLYPSMSQAPSNSAKVTEMIWCMFRSELATFANTQMVKLQKSGQPGFTSEGYTAIDDLKTKDDFIKELEDRIETKYLRHCDPSQPLQLMSLLGGRSSMNLIRFIAHHPRRWAKLKQVPASERQFVWDIVISLLEQYNMMQSNSQLRRFAWSVPYIIQWQAVIHVLDTLRANPLHKDAVKAWRIIDTLYQNNMEMLLRTDRAIFVAVGNLCLKAFNTRIGVPRNEQGSGSNLSTNTPEYITKLRGQRDAAKARKEAAATAPRSKRRDILDSVKRLTTTDMVVVPQQHPRNEPPVLSAVIAPVGAGAGAGAQQQSPTVNPMLAATTRTGSGDDSLWLSEALADDFLTAGTADMMELDTDTMLAQDYWVDTPHGEVIDWAQWDGWFGTLGAPKGGPSV